jgi:hypothetical protein
MQDRNPLCTPVTSYGFLAVGRSPDTILDPEKAALAELERIQQQNPPSDDDLQHLESILVLRAYVLGWTGDPLQQPATSVLAAYRQMLGEKAGIANRCLGFANPGGDE